MLLSAVSGHLPDRVRNPLRAAFHLSVYTRHLANGFEVWRYRDVPAKLPPLRFRNGMVWHHGPFDEPLLMLRELYTQRLYDGYRPERGHRILDIGANMGAVSLMWASVAPGVTIHAYEPNPQAFATLARNVVANAFEQRIVTYGEAVGATEGSLELWVDVPTAHATAFGPTPAAGGRKLAVPLVSLRTAWERIGGGMIDMLKIDAEGGEVAVLDEDSLPVLAATQRVIVEYHDNLVHGAYEHCMTMLDRAGLTCTVRHHPWQEGIITAYRD